MASCKVNSDEIYPVLFIPKMYRTIKTNCDVYINILCKSSLDSEGNNTSIYKGLCHIKLVESNNVMVESPDSSSETYTDEMPARLAEMEQLFLPYNKSQACIDPSTSPDVNNHFVPLVQEPYTNHDSKSKTTVDQHSTYITQNVNDCKISQTRVKDIASKKVMKVPEMVTMAQPDANPGYYADDELESSVLFSQLPDEIMTENMTTDWEDINSADEIKSPQEHNAALEQLMSPNIQSTSKERKTILFLGQNSHSGRTIENISYYDPTVMCAEVEMADETLFDTSPDSNKKKYRCDKCKQIFNHILSFRRHMVGNDTNLKKYVQMQRDLKLKLCRECGKCFKNQREFEAHCYGHRNPDLKCSICQKVFASKVSLRVHTKIHSRKYSCPSCFKTYVSFNYLKVHMEKIHFLQASQSFSQDENCLFVSKRSSELNNHHCPKSEVINELKTADMTDVLNLGTTELKSQIEKLCRQLLNPTPVISSGQERSDTNPDLISLGHDLSKCSYYNYNYNLAGSNQEPLSLKQEQSSSNQEQSSSNQEQSSSNQEQSSSSDFMREGSSLDVVQSYEDLSPSVDDDEETRIRKADSVIAVNKIFLSNPKMARKHKYCNTCVVCRKTFDRIDKLKRHLIVHIIKYTLIKTPPSRTGNLNIICGVCHTERFTRIDKYKAHLREHSQLTLYQCTICNKSFSDSSNFSKHKKMHAASCLQCFLCNRKFSSKRTLENHVVLHQQISPVQCTFCTEVFPFQSALNKHVRCTHGKGENTKLRCKICDVTCTCLKDKWEHEWRVHKFRKMIVDCHVCGSEFRKNSELKKHCLEEHHIDISSAKK